MYPSNRRRLAPLLSCLAALALLVAACGDGEEAAAGTDHGGDHAHGGDHSHSVLEVPESMTAPTVSVSASPDSVGGVNLSVTLTDFEISPENASTDPVDGQGHLHLYVDGERVMRFYNTDLHLDDLAPGSRELMVEISANNHSAYAVDGTPIRAMATVEVPESDGHDHGHGHGDEGEGHGHGHGEEAEGVEAGDPAPTITLTATADPKSGYNLAAGLTDFTITPAAVNGDHVDGEGHLHWYLDGKKMGRLYGTDWHVTGLTEGSHDVMVEVSANDHRAYQVDGNPITAMTTIEVDADAAMAMGTADMNVDNADVVIDAAYADGEVSVDDDRVDVPIGSLVAITISSDVEEHVHLHGYDVLADITPDSPGELLFTADTAGVFEVELEDSGTFLFEVAVS